MPDREKVIEAIENCIGQPKCKDCPWEDCEVEELTDSIKRIVYTCIKGVMKNELLD